jgi:uncharacterized protein YdiU (UPF0061 family)
MTAGTIRFGFDHSYARLPDRFYARVTPATPPAPRLFAFNRPLADALGLDAEALEAEGAALFSGARLPDDAEPIALAYAGHQFGHFSPQLGDGRALLLGEVIGRDGARRDIQLKGSGPTPFSLRGDGLAALGPVMREYLVSEAMHAMGLPTTRALAAAVTGGPVWRETALPGAVLARVAASHIRVGTFEYFAARGDVAAVKALAAYALGRHYPEAAEAPNPALALLEGVAARQAALVARWMWIGFIHGVMNTDNMTISGETIDYGPCAFMDAYHPARVYSAIDERGRYAYANQPRIAHWNLAKLAEALLPAIDAEPERAVEAATAALDRFPAAYEAAWTAGARAKLGIAAPDPEDAALAAGLLSAMAEGDADFTLTFRRLADAAEDPAAEPHLRALFSDAGPLDAWLPRWRARLAREGGDPAGRAAAMRATSPAVIPRNHRIAEAIAAAEGEGDFAPFHALHAALARPFDETVANAPYRAAPAPHEIVARTFCGT